MTDKISPHKTRDSFGSGFNQNAIRRGGVVCSIVEHSVRTETSAVKAASEEAIRSLKAAVEQGVFPQSTLLPKTNGADMTDKFDPEATPECDKWHKIYDIMSDGFGKLWRKMAKAQERRARIAERKLEIAITALKDIRDDMFNSGHESEAQDALTKIEEVGK